MGITLASILVGLSPVPILNSQDHRGKQSRDKLSQMNMFTGPHPPYCSWKKLEPLSWQNYTLSIIPSVPPSILLEELGCLGAHHFGDQATELARLLEKNRAAAQVLERPGPSRERAASELLGALGGGLDPPPRATRAALTPRHQWSTPAGLTRAG